MSKEDNITPHIHAEVIKAWAMGEQIEFSFDNHEWRDCNGSGPSWAEKNYYRVKPKPPKNIELYANAEMYKGTDISYAVSVNDLVGNFSTKFISTDNLKLTFCGVTGKLLLAEVVAHPFTGEDNDF